MSDLPTQTLLAASPPGTQVTRFPRRTDFAGNFLQAFCALFFASYFFFAPIAGAFVLLL
jgi:hypothetical protein